MMTCPNKSDLTQARPDSRTTTRQAYEREHQIAESLQRLLLRSHPRQALPGVCVESFYQAALNEASVGGDSFDAFPLTAGRVALVVADASGKGLEAAERIAEIRFALRAFLREHDDPARALSCLNDFVCDAQRLGGRDDAAFATLTLAVLEATSGKITCLCAGGETPLVLRAGGAVEVVPICGSALGLFPRQEYASAELRFGPNDAVLLMTDGLTEARCLLPRGTVETCAGAFLDIAGLEQLARQAWDPLASPCQIGHSIFEGARRFAGGSFHDDACLLVGRRQAL